MICTTRTSWVRVSLALLAACVCAAASAVAADETFDQTVKRLQGQKASFAKRQQSLLAERYDLADRPAAGVTMSRGKPVQEGVRARLPKGMTWESARGAARPTRSRARTSGRPASSRCRIRTRRPAA